MFNVFRIGATVKYKHRITNNNFKLEKQMQLEPKEIKLQTDATSTTFVAPFWPIFRANDYIALQLYIAKIKSYITYLCISVMYIFVHLIINKRIVRDRWHDFLYETLVLFLRASNWYYHRNFVTRLQVSTSLIRLISISVSTTSCVLVTLVETKKFFRRNFTIFLWSYYFTSRFIDTRTTS